MRAATITLIAMTLIARSAQRAQAQVAGQEFTFSAFILALRIPTNVANPDGRPMTTGPTLWFAVKNTTATSYSLCTAATGGFGPSGGGLSGNNHCSRYWIVLPGETHFESLSPISVVPIPIPQDLDTTFGVTVILEGKPVGSMGSVTRWSLSWKGTYAEAIALGDKMKGRAPKTP